MLTKKSCFVVLLILSFLIAACAEKETEPVSSECTDELAEVFVSAEDVDVALRTFNDGAVLGGVGVRALRPCEDISGPLAAINWWTVLDPEGNSDYTAVVGPLVFELGAQLIFGETGYTTLMQPEGTAPDGTRWLQETLEIPLYPMAESFAGMIAGKEWLSVGGYKLNDTKSEDYDFVFQRCFYGCEVIQAAGLFLAQPSGTMMAHLLNASQSQVQDVIEPLRAELESSSLGYVYFVGYSWAEPFMKLESGGERPPSMNGAWFDATILIHVFEGRDPQDVLDLPSYGSFLETATNNTVLVFE